MYTVRQLIHSAYKISSVCGIGQTPTFPETDEALEILNGILDNFGMENLFKPGIITKTITSKTDGTVIIANDGSRLIISGIGNGTSYTINTSEPHNLTIGDNIVIARNGMVDGNFTVNGILSMTSFTIPSTNVNTTYSGSFKLATQSDAYLIDLPILSPNSILNVVDGTTTLTEYTSDVYYNNRNESMENCWYYETALDPYPTLYLDGQRTVQITFYQSGYRNVNLDVDTDKWELGMKEAIKWRLASDLAMINGYADISTQCLNRFSEVLAKYRTKHRKSFGLISDSSAPGYSGGYYDISTDSFI